MFWGMVALIIVVLVVCECISDCVTIKYKHRNTSCCDDCPYRDECLEVFESANR